MKKNSLKKYSGACLILAFALAGCGSGNGSSDSRPGNQTAYQQDSSNCSSQFVTDYNRVASSIKYARTSSDLVQAQNLVSDFGSKYRGVVCQAALLNGSRLDNTPTSVSVDSKVSEWSQLIASAQGQGPSHSNPAPERPITAVPDSNRDLAISSLYSGISLEVVDAEAFNRFASGGASVLIQNGQSTPKYSIDRYSALCFVQATDGRASYRRGDMIRFTLRIDSNKLSGVSLDRPLNLGCLKAAGLSDDWKLRDLDQVFSGVAKVISNN